MPEATTLKFHDQISELTCISPVKLDQEESVSKSVIVHHDATVQLIWYCNKDHEYHNNDFVYHESQSTSTQSPQLGLQLLSGEQSIGKQVSITSILAAHTQAPLFTVTPYIHAPVTGISNPVLPLLHT